MRLQTNFLKSFVSTVFTDWHFMRWIKLGLGLFILWQVIQRPDIFSGFVATFLLFQALTNTGCCGASGCAVRPTDKKEDTKIRDIDYEEIKH